MKKPNHQQFPRFRVVTSLMLIGLTVLLGRLFYLQVFRADYFADLARRQHERTITLQSRRESIYDRQGRILAMSMKAQSIHAIPQQIKHPNLAAKQLAAILGQDESRLRELLNSDASFVWLKRQAGPNTIRAIRSLDLEGVGFLNEFRRYYPSGSFAGALLGFTGVDLQGLEGLEYEYERLLQGPKTFHIIEKDGRHRRLPTAGMAIQTSPQYSLILTIDRTIQHFAESALKRGVDRMRAEKGVALVMHSQTGAILAMANYPEFDPNRFQAFDRKYYLNHAVSSGYEPGSTFKLITLTAALEKNIIQPQQSLYCEQGKFEVADQVIHDTSKHDWLSMEEIIQKSSNICAAKIGMMMTPDQFYEVIQRFGFGEKTGLGLSGEASGKVPKPEEWTVVDHASISFGHGILASPIQVVTALNTIANDGIYLPPYIIEYARDQQGKTHHKVRLDEGAMEYQFGASKGRRLISEQSARVMRQYMISVTQPGGTGTLASVDGFLVAGKTGTSEVFDETTQSYSKSQTVASFVGMVPAHRPVLTILVLVEHPRKSSSGGIVAAPIFAEIARKSLFALKVLPTTEPVIPTDEPEDKQEE